MKKSTSLYYNEIDLISLLKIIWDGKIKIVLITIISFLVGFGYNSQTQRNYLNSFTINPSEAVEFFKVYDIQNLLNSNQSNQLNQSNPLNQSNQLNHLYLDRFIDELADYEEFFASVKKTKKTQEIELFKYKKLLEIDQQKELKNYKINFKWHNIEEAKDILQDTINLTLINLEKSIYKELDLTIKKKYHSTHLDFLKKQRWIAKELNISDIPYGYTGDPYYLRGYLAIDKEIQVFKNNLDFLKKEINSLKKDDIKWIKYDLIKEKSLQNTKLILMISILLGLIVGVFFVFISNAFHSHTASRKTK